MKTKRLRNFALIAIMLVGITVSGFTGGDHTGTGNGGGDARLEMRHYIDNFFNFLILLDDESASEFLEPLSLDEYEAYVQNIKILETSFSSLVYSFEDKAVEERSLVYMLDRRLRSGDETIVESESPGELLVDIDNYVNLTDHQKFVVACSATMTMAREGFDVSKCIKAGEMVFGKVASQIGPIIYGSSMAIAVAQD